MQREPSGSSCGLAAVVRSSLAVTLPTQKQIVPAGLAGAKMTKTEKTLLTRSRSYGSVYVDGKREVDAAKKLVAKGLAVRFENLSSMSTGEYYIHPFTRRPAISKTVFVYGGTLYF